MELETKDHKMTSGGLGKTIAYTMDTSGVIFDTLFQKLYSNPIGSIVREIYTNAMEVSTPDKPPILHCPSLISPEFWIRDFGPGLSFDQMKSVYTVAGASTKRTSNEFIGAFGLGAKSPFAYADSYTVTSWQNGIRSTYLVYRDKERIPSMSVVNEVPSSEPSGLEVRIGVSVKDVGSWWEAIVSQLRGMPILPTLMNTTKTIPPLPPGQHAFGPVSFNSVFSQACLRMGGPLYYVVLPTMSVPLSGIGLLIDAPIGSVDLTPSRENLLYSTKTKDYLKKVIEEFIDHHRKDIVAKFSACTDIYDASLLAISLHPGRHGVYNNINTNNQDPNSLPPIFARALMPTMWKGKTLRRHFDLPDVYNEYYKVPNHTDVNSYAQRVTLGGSSEIYSLQFDSINNRVRVPRYWKNVPTLDVVEAASTHIYLVDTDQKLWRAKLKQIPMPTATTVFWSIRGISDMEVDRIIDALKNTKWPNVVNTRTIDYIKPPAKKRDPGVPRLRGHFFQAKFLNGNRIKRDRTTKFPSTDSGYYVYSVDGTAWSTDQLATGTAIKTHIIWKFISEVFTNRPRIIIIPESDVKRFAKVLADPNCTWKPVSILIDELLQAMYDKLWVPGNSDARRTVEEYRTKINTVKYVHPKFRASVNALYVKWAALLNYTDSLPPITQPYSSSGHTFTDIMDMCAEVGFSPVQRKIAASSAVPELKDFIDFISTPEYTEAITYLTTYRNALINGSPELLINLIEGKP